MKEENKLEATLGKERFFTCNTEHPKNVYLSFIVLLEQQSILESIFLRESGLTVADGGMFTAFIDSMHFCKFFLQA